MKAWFAALVLTLAGSQIAGADVIKSAPDHFTLKQEAVSELSPEDLWDKLLEPSLWWHHSYSGDVQNMSLDPKINGLWKEEWTDGSVIHGRILYISDGKQIRFDAPFGPLQAMAVTDVWTITIAPDGETGSRVTFDEVANGSSESGLDKLAGVVDQVKTEAILRLVASDGVLTETNDAEDPSETAETD